MKKRCVWKGVSTQWPHRPGRLTRHSLQTRVEESASRLQELHDLLEDQPVLRLLAHPVHQLHVVHGADKRAQKDR